jgi:hypothetical protein
MEIVVNGVAVAAVEATGSPARAEIEGHLDIGESGYLAARCWGRRFLAVADKNSYCTAHTSPIYLQVAGAPHRADPIKVAYLSDQINRLLNWAESGAKYENDKQRDNLTGIFKRAAAQLVERAKGS